jgi:hypothetical protein
MNNPYGSRAERDDRERRALRDRRDQRHGEQYDDPFSTAEGRKSYSRDNEYRFDENRGRSTRYGSGEHSSVDPYSRSGQSDWSSRSYPRQQSSFERAGYDSDREFWEGQGSQSAEYSQGRFGTQRSEYQPGRFGGSSGRATGYRSGQHDFSQPSSDRYNYWEHSGAGGYQPEHRREQRYGSAPDNDWQHGGRFGYQGGYGGPGNQGGGHEGVGSGHYWGAGRESGGYMGAQLSARARNRPPKGYTRSDERLREDICESLMHSPFIDAGEVSVAVKEGKVTLEGSVPERSMKHRIEDIAEQCSGVKDVDNRIRIARDQGEHGLWGSSGSSASSESTGASGASSGAPHASAGKTR